MPIVEVYGLPDAVRDSQSLADLVLKKIPEAVAGVEGLGCTTEQVTTFAPRDLLQKELGDEIIGFINSSRFPPGSEQLQKEACDRVAAVLENFANELGIDWHLIEVMPRPLPPIRAERARPKA